MPLYNPSGGGGIGTATAQTNVTWTANTAGLSLNASGYAGTGTTATNATLTLNSQGLQISVAAPGAGGSINFSAGTTSSNLTQLKFVDSNGVSFGLQTGSVLTATVRTDFAGVGETVTTTAGTDLKLTVDTAGVNIAHPVWITTARASNDAIGLNTAATNVTWTVNSSGLSLNAGGYAGTGTSATNATLTLNSNGLAISVAAPGAGGGFAAQGSGTYTQNTGTIAWANSNGVTFGLSTNQMTASVNSTSNVGLNTAATNVTWTVNSGGISLNAAGYAGTATAATNATLTLDSSGLSINCPPSGAPATMMEYHFPDQLANPLTNSTLGLNSIYIAPFQLNAYLSASRIMFFLSVSTKLSASNATGQCGYTLSAAIYYRDAGTNSTRMTQLWSNSIYANATCSSNTRLVMTNPVGLANATNVSYQSTSLSTSNASTYLQNSVGGYRAWPMPMSLTTISPGKYWIAVANSWSIANTTMVSIQASVNFMTASGGGGPIAYQPVGTSSSASNVSWKHFNVAGTYSATSAAFPVSIALNANQIRGAVGAGSVSLPLFAISGYQSTNDQL